MAHPHLTLDGVSYILPDGRPLFSQLDFIFHAQRTGLVGRNGVGKTVLARLLAGQLQASAGRCLRSGPVHYLAQQVAASPQTTAAGLAGLQAPLDALARIEAGSVEARDFELLAERWDLRQRLESEWRRSGLEHVRVDTPAQTLSGGEASRVALSGAMLSGADFLILDEPSNHLDRPQRLALIEQLRRWPRGLLLISHDRQLLAEMDNIVELSPQGLASYGGAYAFTPRRRRSSRPERSRCWNSASMNASAKNGHCANSASGWSADRRAASGAGARPTRPSSCWAASRSAAKAAPASCVSSRMPRANAWRRRCATPPAKWSAPPRSPCTPCRSSAAPRALFTLDAVELPFAPRIRAASASAWAPAGASASSAPTAAANPPCSRCWPGNCRRARRVASRRSAPIWIRTWPGWAGARRGGAAAGG